MTTQQRNSSDALYQRGFQYQTNPDYGHSKRPREKLLELPEDEFCYGGCQARRAKSEFSKTQLKQAPCVACCSPHYLTYGMVRPTGRPCAPVRPPGCVGCKRASCLGTLRLGRTAGCPTCLPTKA